jgi:hypothetical protein
MAGTMSNIGALANMKGMMDEILGHGGPKIMEG